MRRADARIKFEKAKANFDKDFPIRNQSRLARAGDELDLLLTKKKVKKSENRDLLFLREFELESAAIKIQSLFGGREARKQLIPRRSSDKSSFDLAAFERERYQELVKPNSSFDLSDFEKNRYGRLVTPDELRQHNAMAESISSLSDQNNALNESWTEITQQDAQQAADENAQIKADQLAKLKVLVANAKEQIAAYHGMFNQNNQEFSGDLFNQNQAKLHEGLSIAQLHLKKMGTEFESLKQKFEAAGQ